MTIGSQLQEVLEQHANTRIKLRINDNHSTVLSVRSYPDHLSVSLHRLFLTAPANILLDLAAYISGKIRSLTPKVKAFMERAMESLDYSSRVKGNALLTIGMHHNLKNLFNEINSEYFDNQVVSNVTWFGRKTRAGGTSATLGLYSHPMKLIKIHRRLDHSFVPEYFVSYVIFHEMLHQVCPTYHDALGRHYVHTKEFKRREKQFKYYDEATRWLDENEHLIFN
ncbi:MAG: SprT-like domain-containing protein [Waddliaceae bacterium]